MSSFLINCGLLVFSLAFWTCDDPAKNPLPIYGADANPTGDPIGGGGGYSKIVGEGDYLVHNASELLAALSSAKPGKTILVASDANIDLTGHFNLEIPEGTTLAGNRGASGAPGPLIFTTSMPAEGILFYIQKNVRITGLRFKGPDANYADINYAVLPDSKVICFAAEGENIEVENCEVSNFARGGVEIYPNGKDVHVHHCYLHDIHAYPVIVLNRSALPVLVEANRIHWIWTAVAGSGYPGSGYEARYNIIVREAVPPSWQPYPGLQAIDMHPYLEVAQERNDLIAGDQVIVHHNTFVNNASGDPSVLTSLDASIRGVPRILAEFYNNIFLQSTPAQSIEQEKGNIWVYDNLYGPQQTHIAISPETTPQILFIQPPAPGIDIPFVTGNITLDVRINTLDTLALKKVVVLLNSDTIYSGNKAPALGDLIINTATLNGTLPHQQLTVMATDSRNVTGTHKTVFRIQ